MFFVFFFSLFVLYVVDSYGRPA